MKQELICLKSGFAVSLDKKMPLTNLSASGRDALQQLGLSVKRTAGHNLSWALLLILALWVYLGQKIHHLTFYSCTPFIKLISTPPLFTPSHPAPWLHSLVTVFLLATRKTLSDISVFLHHSFFGNFGFKKKTI